MYRFFCRRTQFQLLVPSSVTHYHCIRKEAIFSKSLSSKSVLSPQEPSFVVSYLMNSIGFSSEQAVSLSKKLKGQFESHEQPDSVIKLLKNYGFSNTHVSKLVSRNPGLLFSNAQNTLMPKLEYFGSIGIEGTDLADALCGNPSVLNYSLEENLMPCLDIIRNLPIPKEKVAVFLGNSYKVLSVRSLSNIPANVSFLREFPVSEDHITLFLVAKPYAMARDNAKFRENVNKVVGMGFCPSRFIFINALEMVSLMHPSLWEKKVEFYQNCGWTEDDFVLAFRTNPFFVYLSEKNVLGKIDFLVNRLGWQPAYIARNPCVLSYSMEKWIIPRCSVIRVLLLKGLIIKGEFSLAATLTRCKNDFLDRFVMKYQEQVPELLDIFHGKMSLSDVGLGFEENLEQKFSLIL